MDARVVVVAVVALGLLAWGASAYASQVQGSSEQPADGGGSWWGDSIGDAINDLGEEVDMSQQQNQQPVYSQDANVRAFLEAIKLCEGTKSAGEYACLYGSRPGALRTFSDFSDHPRIVSRISATDQRWTSAAGAYQIMAVSPIPGGGSTRVDTWDRMKRKLGLPDFSPTSQDAAAVELLRECGALAAIERGDIAAACRSASAVWASLPGAGYGQPTRTLAQVRAWYSGAGGYLA